MVIVTPTYARSYKANVWNFITPGNNKEFYALISIDTRSDISLHLNVHRHTITLW